MIDKLRQISTHRTSSSSPHSGGQTGAENELANWVMLAVSGTESGEVLPPPVNGNTTTHQPDKSTAESMIVIDFSTNHL